MGLQYDILLDELRATDKLAGDIPSWIPNTFYTPDTEVIFNGSIYSSVSEHTSGIDFNTDLAAEKWTSLGNVPTEATGAEIDTGIVQTKFASPKALQDSKYIKSDNITPEADQIAVLKDGTGKELKNTTTKIIAGEAIFRKADGFPADFSGFQNNDFGVATPLSDAWLAAKIAGTLFQFQPNTWRKITKTFSHFSIAATTNTINLGVLLKGAEILRGVFIKHNQSFIDGIGSTISNYTISVGITGNVDKFASAFDVFQVVDGAIFQLSQNYFMENALIDTSIVLTATSTGANLDAATQGSVSIYFITERIEL